MEACVKDAQPVQREVYKAFIRAEVLASEGPVAEWPSSSVKRAADASPGSGAARIEGDTFKSSSSTKVPATGGKVPKWMKLGR